MRFVKLDGRNRQVVIDVSPEAEPELRSLERRALWLRERANRPLHERMDPFLQVHLIR